jgi:hypothetical protein
VHWLGQAKVIYYLIDRSKILLLVQFDSTGENVKQILIAHEIPSAATEPNGGAREAHDGGVFLGDSAPMLTRQRRDGEMIQVNLGCGFACYFR